ncbi:hypothetical protein [Dongia sp.]|uniref:hypothetical protein n=1 Tax=Dongia sp. TaxID=1977262 RepID=UPI0037537DD1
MARTAAFYAALFVLALVPVFSFGILPLGDMPNHLARAFIMNALPSDPDLQKYYAIEWRFFSFQSTDLILPLLIKAFGLELGARLFIVATFALLIGGTVALHRAFFGRVGLWPAAAMLFLFSFPFALGQISFLLTTGLSLLLFAAWIASLARHGLVKVLLFSAASLALLLCHFFAFAAYALLVGAHAGARWWRDPDRQRRGRDLAEAGAPFVLPVLVYLLSFTASIHGRSFYGDLAAKAVSVLAATITYGTWPDVVVTVAVIVGLWILHRRGLLSFAAGMRLPVLVLVVAAIAMPRMLQGVLGADLRIPCLLAFLLVAASDVAFRSRREMQIFCAAVIVLMTFRVATLIDQWRVFDADYREFRAAAATIERGSRVMVIPFDLGKSADRPRLPYWYLASLAVIDRSAFLPHLYTIATPLRFTDGRAADLVGPALAARPMDWQPASPAFAGTDAETVAQVGAVIQRMAPWDTITNPIDWSDWPEQYDILVDLDFGEKVNPVPALLTEVGRGAVFTLYRIHPPQ